jgi:hypothetical protein
VEGRAVRLLLLEFAAVPEGTRVCTAIFLNCNPDRIGEKRRASLSAPRGPGPCAAPRSCVAVLPAAASSRAALLAAAGSGGQRR